MKTVQTIIMDVSRLLARARSTAPTGIDRIEKAYTDYLLARPSEQTGFVAIRGGRAWTIPRQHVVAVSHALDQQWSARTEDGGDLARALDWSELQSPKGSDHPSSSPSGAYQRPLLAPWRPLGFATGAHQPTYLNVSHHHLDKKPVLEQIKSHFGARVIMFIHDAIPVQFPEYCRPGHGDRHRRRLDTVDALADGVLVNSSATERDLRQLVPGLNKRQVPTKTVPLWLEDVFARPVQVTPPSHPYFVCVGTIEARKNHTLLLSLWRDLVAQLGPACPRLVLVGRRGWENDTALALLDRSNPLKDVVIEAGALNDQDLAHLLHGARALLLPSFAEGFGLPVVEALGAGTPVIASDLPALREVGQGAPDYLSALDGLGWRDAILAYTQINAPRREAQLDRLRGLNFLTRTEHLETAFAWIAETGVKGQAAHSAPTETAR